MFERNELANVEGIADRYYSEYPQRFYGLSLSLSPPLPRLFMYPRRGWQRGWCGRRCENPRSTHRQAINLHPPTLVRNRRGNFHFSYVLGCVSSLDLVYDFSSSHSSRNLPRSSARRDPLSLSLPLSLLHVCLHVKKTVFPLRTSGRGPVSLREIEARGYSFNNQA